MLGRGLVPVLAAAALVSLLLLVTFDLDRPTRGLITIPDTPLTNQRPSELLQPAAPPLAKGRISPTRQGGEVIAERLLQLFVSCWRA